MICPTHQAGLIATRTRFGVRNACPVDGCTVVQWDGSTSTPADQETRSIRHACHRRFDPLWKESGGPFPGDSKLRRRQAAYKWLAESMGLADDQAHFGMFNLEQCRVALRLINTISEKPYGPRRSH